MASNHTFWISREFPFKTTQFMSPKIMYQTRFEMIKFHKPNNKSFDLVQVSKLMTTRMREEKVCVNIFLKFFCHCGEKLHEVKGYVQHYCVHNNMP